MQNSGRKLQQKIGKLSFCNFSDLKCFGGSTANRDYDCGVSLHCGDLRCCDGHSDRNKLESMRSCCKTEGGKSRIRLGLRLCAA